MPISPIDRIRLDKAAVDQGFGLTRPEDGDWLVYEGLGTPAIIRMTAQDGHYIVAVNHTGVVTDLAQRWTRWGNAAFSVDDTGPLHQLVGEIRRLARALPHEPLRKFEAETQALPRTTEAQRMVVQRIGQNIFREALQGYWGDCCAVTGVTHRDLLRASHIVPWAACETDAARLDVYNGLLLAAHLDAAFDAGLISFNDGGRIQLSAELTQQDRQALCLDESMRLRQLAAGHLKNLAWHRANVFL